MSNDILSLLPPYQLRLAGRGMALRRPGGVSLTVGAGDRWPYSNAQIDDYRHQGGARFPNRPPLTLRVRARFSHEADSLRGTAGFGFWNYPLVLAERDWPRLPAALWFFFGSPPANMALASNVPGNGFKAAVIDATRPQALALLPLVPLAVPLFNLAPFYRHYWPPVQRAVGISEAPIRLAMTDWHDYALHWGRETVDFLIDGAPLLSGAPAPRGPLCLVVWLDNQYLVITPQGRFGWGLLAIGERQWLELEELTITPGA